jgi:hypothetical protein
MVNHMNNFISIKEAAAFSGRSESTIKRLILKVLEEHRDDQAMVDQVIQKQRAAKGYFWYISRDFLTIELGLDRPMDDHGAPAGQSSGQSAERPKAANGEPVSDQVVDQWGLASEIIAILKEQLKVKDEQIRNFQERDKENNILLKTFQDKIFLLEGGRPHNERVVYEDQPERVWERGPEESGEPEGDAATEPQQERGEAGNADVREEGDTGGVTDEEEIAGSPEPDREAPSEVEEKRGDSVGEVPREEAGGEAATAAAAAAVEVDEKKTPEEGSQLPTVSGMKRGFWRRVFGG